MLRTLTVVLGAVTALFPDGIVALFERLAIKSRRKHSESVGHAGDTVRRDSNSHYFPRGWSLLCVADEPHRSVRCTRPSCPRPVSKIRVRAPLRTPGFCRLERAIHDGRPSHRCSIPGVGSQSVQKPQERDVDATTAAMPLGWHTERESSAGHRDRRRTTPRRRRNPPSRTATRSPTLRPQRERLGSPCRSWCKPWGQIQP